MNQSNKPGQMKTLILLLAASSALSAGQTRTWAQGEAADFEKGILKDLSLRSDGRLTLAPLSRELFDPASSYLWALARDSKGNLYAGGGTGATEALAIDDAAEFAA